jgi:DNA-directed RNA polymerase subunit M/transcription elongation factor TFIIS
MKHRKLKVIKEDITKARAVWEAFNAEYAAAKANRDAKCKHERTRMVEDITWAEPGRSTYQATFKKLVCLKCRKDLAFEKSSKVTNWILTKEGKKSKARIPSVLFVRMECPKCKFKSTNWNNETIDASLEHDPFSEVFECPKCKHTFTGKDALR